MAELRPWDIGWVPAGWTKGKQLEIRRPSQWRRGDHGTIHEPWDLWAHDPTDPITAEAIAYVTFELPMSLQVQAWLDWWYSPNWEPEPSPAVLAWSKQLLEPQRQAETLPALAGPGLPMLTTGAKP